MKKIGVLHVITDIVFQDRFSHVELAQMAVTGGADTIQFRQKEGSTRELIETAIAMKEVCVNAGVPLIVNDRIDVAIAAEADGVHLGQNDFPIAKARGLLGDFCIIGGTAKTLDQAQQCISEGADYVGFGPIYATGSKADAGVAKGTDGLRDFVNALDIPIIAIGGIGLEMVGEVMGVGAYGIAVISAVCSQDDPTEATRALVANVRV
jgi:thiamine-phosphate pyrophosphorylase